MSTKQISRVVVLVAVVISLVTLLVKLPLFERKLINLLNYSSFRS